MASNLMGLVLTIIACSNLLSAAILNRKYNGEKLHRYFDEGRWTREEELKRYKWMADESSTQSPTSSDGDITSEKQNETSMSSPKEGEGFINNQERLLNAVALIKEVLESANSSGLYKMTNKTEQLKRDVLHPEQKDRLASGTGQAYEEDEDEINKYERDFDEKVPNFAENHEDRQMKLKKTFWDTNRDKYLNSFSSSLRKDEADKALTSDNQLGTFDKKQEDMSLEGMGERLLNYKRKREEGTSEPSTSTTESVNPSSTESTTESTTGKSFVRRNLFLNRGARFGLISRNGNKFNIRKKRIGELNYNTIEGSSENKSYRRRCGGIRALKRDIQGCGM